MSSSLWKRAALGGLVAALLPLPGPGRAAVEVESETIFRYFEREAPDGGEENVVPIYEYLRVAAGELEWDGLSLHAFGWGRHDFGGDEFFDDQTQGEVLYGYLQYYASDRHLAARLGRQYVFSGVANESVDGVRVQADATPYFSLDLYAGSPVAVEELDGRDGDWLWGGRIGHRWKSLYTVGLSYKRLKNDGDEQEELLGVDSHLSLPAGIALSGFSSRNLVDEGWQEHSYEGRVPLGGFLFRPLFHKFHYDAYFDTQESTASPFRFLQEAEETVVILGADAVWTPRRWLEVQGRFKHYNYTQRHDDARYYAGLATLRGDGRSELGGEVGVMDGDSEDNQYSLWRGYFHWDRSPGFLTGDLVYVRYDQEILDESRSLFASLGAGTAILDDKLELRLSGDFSSDPYFDEDFRGMLNARYLLDL